MAKFKIDLVKNDCIGCGACTAVSPEFWEMTDDGKTTIKGGEKVNSNEEMEIGEKDLASNKEAAESCPVNVIHITNLENNEKVI
ncbi:ferredoxin [Candidatus Pacearchaeota archaeon]|nr:ferredoxin [Candidatus Pacearchaeota archaeon]